MNFKEILEIAAAVIASLGGGGAIVFGFSGYLGKVWADRALEKLRQENTKLNLEASHRLGLLTEQAKSALQLRVLEHQVRFAKLFEKRAEAIEKLHELAYELEVRGQRYTLDLGRGGREAYQELVNEIRKFDAFCESHRIYLSEGMETALYKFLNAVKEPIVAIGVYGDFGSAPHETLRQHKDVILAAVEAANERVPAVRGALIKEFRAILDATP